MGVVVISAFFFFFFETIDHNESQSVITLQCHQDEGSKSLALDWLPLTPKHSAVYVKPQGREGLHTVHSSSSEEI